MKFDRGGWKLVEPSVGLTRSQARAPAVCRRV